ncbi:MAG: HAD family phosphatase [Atopobiaceae bacterium]|nr:HAD family phosphatase [Atopobiaceae bacterium]
MVQAPKGLWPFEFEAAIVDFDGTIADSAPVWSKVDHAFLAKRGLPYAEDYSCDLAALGFAAGARYTIDRFGLDEDPADICDEWNDLARDLYRKDVELRPGAERYLRALRGRGVPVALATTNDPEVLFSLEPRIDIHGLFDEMVFGREVGKPKNQPDIYLEAARRLGVEPWGCVVFEDIVPGLLSCESVGMTGCAVRSNDPSQTLADIIEAGDLFLEDWRCIEL